MKKLYVLVLAVGAVFAFGAMTASAIAASKLLFNGAENTVMQEVQTTGELILHNLSNGAEILCSGIFDALVEPGGVTGAINEVLMLDTTLLAETALDLSGTSVAGDDIECLPTKLCSNNPTLVVAINLPWNLSIVLVGGKWIQLFPTNAGYQATCVVLGITVTITCDGVEAEAELFNDATTGDAMGKFEETLGPEASCSDGSTAALQSVAPAPITANNGELVTVSE